MHTEATGIMPVGGITATAGIVGMAGDVAGTLTGGGAPWRCRTTTGALGATRIMGVLPYYYGGYYPYAPDYNGGYGPNDYY